MDRWLPAGQKREGERASDYTQSRIRRAKEGYIIFRKSEDEKEVLDVFLSLQHHIHMQQKQKKNQVLSTRHSWIDPSISDHHVYIYKFELFRSQHPSTLRGEKIIMLKQEVREGETAPLPSLFQTSSRFVFSSICEAHPLIKRARQMATKALYTS